MNLQHLPTSVNSHQDITLHILMAHRLQTSLDKGTQRKTTENELPSLTQCTA